MKELRVLVVEDDPRIADLHRRFAEKVPGYEVVGLASDYADAREQALVLEPDLILLDLYLPSGSGLDLLQELRADGRQVDVILLTAARETATLQAALRGGVFDYIIKPIVFKRFEEALGEFRAYRERLEAGAELQQEEVDRLLRTAGGTGSAAPGAADMPKGIDPLTLNKVRDAFAAADADGFSAEALGARLGMSRSTARRYLEYLVSAGFLSADVSYGTVGRPERRYLRRS